VTVAVVLTREPPRNDALRAALVGRARILEVPLTVTTPRAADDVARAIRVSPVPTWIVVTSARAAPYVSDALLAAPNARVVAVGAVTAAAVRAVIEAEVHVPPTEGAASVADLIDAGPVVSLGAAATRPELADRLARREIVTTHVACYDTVPATLDGFAREQISLGDVVVVAAPSTWLVARASVRRGAVVVVTGTTTRDAVSLDHDHVVVAAIGALGPTVVDLVADLESGQIAPGPR
jgi:uroporphyrinogen-III synthase